MATSPISGSYRGPLTSAPGERQRLDLRIDVDSRIAEAVVVKRVSGDIFSIDTTEVPGKPPMKSEVYQDSWILEQPQVKKSATSVIITGTIRYWNGTHPKATIRIRIPRSPKNAAAEVTIQKHSVAPMTFSCKPAGEFFRSVRLETAICKSVDTPPTLPIYSTHSLDQRPSDLSDRVLTLDAAYGEAGVELVIEPGGVVDDTGVTAWTDAELHNAMEHHFSRYNEPWPRWGMWGLLAGQYEDDAVGGVMFDYAGVQGVPGEAPERQGFAVFRKHFWFNSLV